MPHAPENPEPPPDITLDDATTPYGTPARPAAAPSSPPPVAVSGRYEILGELGHGGMGIVYRARDRETSEVVAIKVLRPEIAADERMMERFKTELRLARQITHKNVCRIFDFNRLGTVACISMELVEGESLRRLLQRLEVLAPRTATRLALEICAAMREAHAQGIVHRDLKPENVMLDGDGHVKVMDFGIAYSGATGESEAGVIGTPAYMSPEQAQGKATDTRTDIYAIGMTLFEMLAGRPAFKAETAAEHLKKSVDEAPPALRELEPSVPEHLERIVLRCLEKDPARRFQSVAELEAALRDPKAELEIPVPPHLLEWRQRDWVLLAIALIGLIFGWARPLIIPAMQQKLTLDENAAKREAERTISKLGFSNPYTVAQVEYRADWYRARYVGPAFEQVGLPLYWNVAFGSGPAWQGWGAPAGHLLLDRDGKLISYERPNVASAFRPQFQVPNADQQRQLATDLARQYCGQAIEGGVLSTVVGGDNRYRAIWGDRRYLDRRIIAAVTLREDIPVQVSCANDWHGGRSTPEPPPFQSSIQSMSRLALVLLVGTTILWFALAQSQVMRLLKVRAPVALLGGAGAAWVIRYEMFDLEWPLLIASTVVNALLLLIALAAVEHRLTRYRPDAVATWQRLFRGRLLDRAVGAAVVRGALGGLVMLGVETLLGHVTKAAGSSGHLPAELAQFFLGIPDPSLALHGVQSGMPALFILGATIATALLVGFLALGLGATASGKWRAPETAREWMVTLVAFLASFLLGLPGMLAALFITSRRGITYPWSVIGAAIAAALICPGVAMPFGQTLSAGVGSLVVPLVLAFIGAVLLLTFDILTAVVAVATYVLVSQCWIASRVLADIGNTAEVAVIGAWAAIVLAATALAFGRSLRQWLQSRLASA